MKEIKKNEKGFTLIELLAVIVILAILIAVAIPATMRYLAQARRGTFASNVSEAVGVVRNDIIVSGYVQAADEVVYYPMDDVNNLLEKTITTSPYSGAIANDETNYIKVTVDSNGNKVYTVRIVDEKGNGFYCVESSLIGEGDSIVLSGETDKIPSDCGAIPSGATIAETTVDGRTTKFPKAE